MKYLTLLDGEWKIHESHAALTDWLAWDIDNRQHANVWELGRKLSISQEWVVK